MQAIIVNSSTSAIDGEWRKELLAWAEALGVDTKRATPTFILLKNTRGWRACFSLKRQRDGHDYIDPNTGRLAVDYGHARFDVAEGSWPNWFGSPTELPNVSAGHLLDALAAAADAAADLESAARIKANPGGVAL
jgi:hypothetical protein